MTTATDPTLPRLGAEIHKPEQKNPEKVLQIGEGNFLRGFACWMIHEMNEEGLFNGSVVVAQPIAQGMADTINEQNGVYTLLMRGLEKGKVVERQKVITSISRCLNPYGEWDKFLACAHNPDLRFIVSNTTEAGIAYCAADKLADQPPSSFPAKLTLLLLERYKAFNGDVNKGFILLPCELINRNGDNLKKTVLKTAKNWKLEAAFIQWIEKANIFTNTLVDRIVTGYPRNEIKHLWEKAGYKDAIFNSSEAFHLWVIEGPESVAAELPLREAGLNAIFTKDMTPYRERKVRILNGAHTSTVLASYLAGKNYVGECMEDDAISSFMRKAIYEEVIPTLSLSKEELANFAESVFERFRNPFIEHAVLSISLNSVSKYKARVLPSLEKYVEINGRIPARLALGLASLIAFYRGTEIRNGALIGERDGAEYQIKDDLPVLETFAAAWKDYDDSQAGAAKIADTILSQTEWWGKDLRAIPGLAKVVATDLYAILTKGMESVLAAVA
jgi:tagaturonate reductase